MIAVSGKPYFVYVIRCTDNSLYTGITTDVERRFKEHTEGRGTGAKYTRTHKPVSLECAWQCTDKGSALKLEYAFKRLSKDAKEGIIKNPDGLNLKLADRTDIDYQIYITK